MNEEEKNLAIIVLFENELFHNQLDNWIRSDFSPVDLALWGNCQTLTSHMMKLQALLHSLYEKRKETKE